MLFFDKKPASETPWTKKLWIYDLRTNKHFTLKTNPLKREDLDEFVALLQPGQPPRAASRPGATEQRPDGRWRVYDYDELVARDKASLDIFWLKDESLADSRQPAAAGGHRAGDRRRPGGGAGAVSADRGGFERHRGIGRRVRGRDHGSALPFRAGADAELLHFC